MVRLAGTGVEEPVPGDGGDAGGLTVGGGIVVEPPAWRAGLTMCEWSMLAVTEIIAEVVGERVRGEDSEEAVEWVDMLLLLGVLH